MSDKHQALRDAASNALSSANIHQAIKAAREALRECGR